MRKSLTPVEQMRALIGGALRDRADAGGSSSPGPYLDRAKRLEEAAAHYALVIIAESLSADIQGVDE